MNKCPVCEHEDREQIEAALFRMTPSTAEKTIDALSEEYNLRKEDLQKHALLHAPYGATSEDSIVRQIKMREAELLSEVTYDNALTLKAVGQRIRNNLRDADPESGKFERMTSKAVVELYVGTGDVVRKNVQTLADIHQLLNGPKDSGANGLLALAKVLEESRNPGATITRVSREEPEEA